MGKLKEWMNKRSLKHQMIEVFQKAGLYIEHQTRGGKVPIYPKIHVVTSSNQCVQYVFTIPNGLDPKIIEKKWFCFQQIFGRNVAIEGDIKKFVLHVFHSDGGLKLYNYSYKQWRPLLKEYRLPVVVGRSVRENDYLRYGGCKHAASFCGRNRFRKSSMVRVVLSTLIQTMSPDTLHLYLGDLKNSEFHFLRRVKHVKEVCMEEVEMKIMLQKIWNEIRERRKLMATYEVDHIDEYNKLHPDKRKPYILLAIDEVAMLQDEKECMTIIEKYRQLVER